MDAAHAFELLTSSEQEKNQKKTKKNQIQSIRPTPSLHDRDKQVS